MTARADAANGSRALPWWLVPAAVYVATAAVFLAWSAAGRDGFPLDDAWIHRVYARAFASGGAFAYNDGVQEAGCTSPLWVIVTAPAQWLGAFGTDAVVWGVKLAGLGCGAAVIAAVYRLARRWTGASWPAAVAASLLACEPGLMFAALSGMEVTLLVALFLWLVVFVDAERWRAAAVMLGLLPVTRPEGAVLVAVCVVGLAIRHRATWRALITRWTVAWAIAPGAAWIAFCLVATGHPLPNTYYLKASGGLTGLGSLGTVLIANGWARSVVVPVAGIVALAAWLHRRRDRAPVVAILALGSLAFVVTVITTRSFLPLGYYWTRWTDPGVLGIAATTALGIAVGLHAFARAPRLALVGAVIVASPWLVASIAERAERLGSDARVIEHLNVAPGRWLAAHTPADAVVAVNDAGALRYFGNRRTIDLLGLNDADLAFGRVSPAAVAQRVDWLAAYPIIFQLDPAFARFTRQRWFTIPRQEYTICDCLGPTEMFVARRDDGAVFDRGQRAAMLDALRGHSGDARIAAASDAAAVRRADELRDILVEAGWRVPPVDRPALAFPRGLFVVTPDRQPSRDAAVVRDALAAAGLAPESAVDDSAAAGAAVLIAVGSM